VSYSRPIVSFDSTIRRAQSSVISYFRYRFIAAYKYILFSSLLFVVVVHASCDKHRFTDAWRMCGTLHGGRSQLLFALQQSSIDRFVENSDFSLSHLHSTPPLGGGGSRWNIAMTFGTENLKWFGYPTVK